MSYRLPSCDSEIRQLFDVAYLVELLQPQNRLKMPTLREVLNRVQSQEWPANVREMHFICMKADGAVVLERVGPRGGHNTVWSFS